MRLKRFAPVLVVAVALIGCAENANPTAPSVTPETRLVPPVPGPVQGNGVGGAQGLAPGTLDCYGTAQQGAVSNPVLTADIDCAVSNDRRIQAGWDTPGTAVTLLRHSSAGAIYVSDGMTAYGTLYKCNASTTEGIWHGVGTRDDLRTNATVVIACAGAYDEQPKPPPPVTCDDGEELVNGVCVVPPPPPPVTCGDGEELVNGVCVVPPPPPPVTCGDGEELVNGVCVVPPPPPPVTCGDGEELVNGVCVVPPPPPPVTCGDGEELVNGVCVVPPPPPPVTCDDGEELVNGVCVVPPPPPPVTCDDGEELVNGVCVVPPPPPPVTCGDGEELVNGVCVVVPPPPPPLTCDEGEEIVNGVCVVVPPLPMTCDDGEEVVDGVCVVIPPPPPPAVFVSPLSCNADPNANSVLDEQSRHDGLPCAVSDDGKLRALRMSGGTIAVQSELDTNVIRSSVEMRKGDQTIPGATAVFWCIANADGSIWHTTETAATTVIVECAD